MNDIRFLPCGESAVTVEFSREIREDVNRKIRFLATALEELGNPAILESVPTFCSLTVYFEPLQLESAALERIIRDVLDGYTNAERVVPKASEIDRQVLLAELVCSPTMPLSKIAEQMGYSARHTARIIKKTYGCSISELRKKQLQSKKE